MLNEMTQSDMLNELSAFTISSEELKLEKLLSKEGATASVHSGFWKENHVAVKMFNDFSTEEKKKEILNEAKIMLKVRSLKSSYLISLKAICLKPYYAIAMELMPQGSLHDLLQSDCKLPWSIRYQIACDVSHGLRDLHDNEIIHRDLKSLNILLNNYRAKLTDFGLAKETGSNFIQTILKTNAIPKGSWPWMAPELFEKGNTWTKEADIYSLGIVLLELVTGKIPTRSLVFGDGAFSIDHPKISDSCPKEIKPLLLSFQTEPKKRLKMQEIIEKLECILVAEQKAQSSSTLTLNPLKLLVITSNSELKESVLPTRLPLHDLKAQIPKSTLPLQQPSPLSQNPFTITASQKVDETASRQLLQYVTEGEQNKAEELIKKDKNLLLYAETITDLSGREFKQITAFQYALWAMDWHMWAMIQKYLPEWTQRQQLIELETKGTSHGKHFNLQGLTSALQTYVDNAEKIWKYDGQATHHWCKVVGREQKLLPAHVVNEYCRADRPFEPCPQEWESKLSRTRELEIYDSSLEKWVKGCWFPSSSKDGLGLRYSFYRYNRGLRGRAAEFGGGWGRCFHADLKALQSLWKTRTQQLKALKSQLLSMASQDQELKTELKELKYKTPVQPPKLTPLVSQSISQTILPPPKPQATPEQLALQDQLIAACKQGDAKAVEALFKRGAKPNIANAKGEQPLGAAVWGMCPDVVNTLLKQAGGVAPMTWQECEQHNLKYYEEVFIIPKFDPQTFEEWNNFLQKMDINLFIRAFHLKKAEEHCHDIHPRIWEGLARYVYTKGMMKPTLSCSLVLGLCGSKTEEGYVGFRTQIKQNIESSKQPMKQQNQAECLVM